MTSIFTNGACDVYAQALSDIYGFRVLNLLNRTGMLLHAFCVDSEGYYVDADGRHEGQEFLKPYIGERKHWKIVEYSGERLVPERYNDIYTEKNFALAHKLASAYHCHQKHEIAEIEGSKNADKRNEKSL